MSRQPIDWLAALVVLLAIFYGSAALGVHYGWFISAVIGFVIGLVITRYRRGGSKS